MVQGIKILATEGRKGGLSETVERNFQIL